MKKILITGSTKGLGLYIAENLFLQDSVVICGSDNERLKEALSKLNFRKSIHGFNVDFLDEKSTEKFCFDVENHFGVPDVIIHNLGASLKHNFNSSYKEWLDVLRINFLASLQIDKFFLEKMIKSKNGVLIFIGSMASYTLDGAEPYVIAKSTLDSYVKILGKITAGSGLLTVGIRPGPINVPNRYLTTIENTNKAEWLTWAENHRIREKRLLTMDEICKTIQYICDNNITYLNGSIIDLFGGSY